MLSLEYEPLKFGFNGTHHFLQDQNKFMKTGISLSLIFIVFISIKDSQKSCAQVNQSYCNMQNLIQKNQK